MRPTFYERVVNYGEGLCLKIENLTFLKYSYNFKGIKKIKKIHTVIRPKKLKRKDSLYYDII